MIGSTTQGRLIAVVGPSGVGKDSVMEGMVAAAPWLKLVRRSITRAPDLGGEAYDAMMVEDFESAVERGEFALHWQAHGLFYGIPTGTLDDVQNGAQCLANLSRSVLVEAATVFPALTVLNLIASPAVLATRLAHRGRETREDIEKRLSRKPNPLPEDLDIITLSNDGALDETVARALAALDT